MGTFPRWAASAVAVVLVAGAPAEAEDSANQQQLDTIKDQIDLLKAKTDLANAQLDQAKTILDQLPKYEGKVETDANTGKFELTVLSAAAMRQVAGEISGQVAQHKGNALILAGGESFAFGSAFALNGEMAALQRAALDPKICGTDCKWPDSSFETLSIVTPSVALAAVSAVAGLLRSDVKLTTLDTQAVDSTMLASAVAAGLNRPGTGVHALVLGGSPGSQLSIDATRLSELDNPDAWGAARRIPEKMTWLLAARESAKVKLAKLSSDDKAKKKYAQQVAQLTQWTKDFDEFQARVTKSTDSSPSPFVLGAEAGELDAVDEVVRVTVQTAAGTLKTTKNIGTFFGGNPLKISGGVIASYTLYRRLDDKVAEGRFSPVAWNLWSCSSNAMTLREVRKVSFADSDDLPNKVYACRSIVPSPH